MNHTKRIFIVSFLLIGAASIFGVWSLNQFNSSFAKLDESYISNNTAALIQASAIVSTSTSLQSEVPFLSFTFPLGGSELFIGCSYDVTWQSSSTITALKASLVGFKSKTILDSETSGLSGISVDNAASGLVWKTKVVLPGEYYVLISDINGTTTSIKSDVFKIKKIPKENSEDKEKVCLTSGGRI